MNWSLMIIIFLLCRLFIRMVDILKILKLIIYLTNWAYSCLSNIFRYREVSFLYTKTINKNGFHYWEYKFSIYYKKIRDPVTLHINLVTDFGWIRKVLLWITIFILMLVNNVQQKVRTRFTNTIYLYKFTIVFLLFISFKLV